MQSTIFHVFIIKSVYVKLMDVRNQSEANNSVWVIVDHFRNLKFLAIIKISHRLIHLG